MKRQNSPSRSLNNSKSKLEVESVKSAKIRKESTLFKRLLGLILVYPGLVSYLVDNLAVEEVEDGLAGLYKILIIFYNSNSDLINRVSVDNSGFDLFDSFKQFIADKKLDIQLTQLVEESCLLYQAEYGELDSKQAKLEMMQLIKAMRLDYFTKKSDFLKRELEKAEVVADKARVDTIYQEISELLQRKNSIK